MAEPETAFITGAGSGIGRAVGRRLARRGARLALFDQSAEGLDGTTALLEADSGAVLAIRGDVREEQQMQDAVARTIDRFGPLTTAVACAGVVAMGRVPKMKLDDWTRLVGVNLTGVFHTARSTIPAMSPEGGTFTAIASDAGTQGAAEFAAYCATKHGVVGLIRSLALDHGPAGIRCNVVCPGFVDTPMADRIFTGLSDEERKRWEETVPLGRFARADEVAAAVAHIASDEASYLNGAVYALDGGSTAGYFQA